MKFICITQYVSVFFFLHFVNNKNLDKLSPNKFCMQQNTIFHLIIVLIIYDNISTASVTCLSCPVINIDATFWAIISRQTINILFIYLHNKGERERAGGRWRWERHQTSMIWTNTHTHTHKHVLNWMEWVMAYRFVHQWMNALRTWRGLGMNTTTIMTMKKYQKHSTAQQSN